MEQKFVLISVASIFLLLVIIQVISKAEHPIKKTFVNILIGVLALVTVNVSSYFTGVSLPVNFLSLGVSAVGGIPGVTMLLLLNIIV